ncbi:MAG TPA: triose-phosphate isomerase [Actinomycetales bacterium]|jgi:triosephosphate isomerase
MARTTTPAPTSEQRTPLMAGNWKMNLDHLQGAHLVQKLDWTLKDAKFDHAAVEVVVLPPFTSLRTVQTLVEGDKLELRYGAQDLSASVEGAYTGEVSGTMLARLGCTYVAVGHSERREQHAEGDAVVNAKVKAALQHGLVPILCVGEGLAVRQAGEQVPHTLAQLDGALEGVSAEQAATLVVAYEPVWAIGTGEVATPDDAQEVCSALRVRLGELYGSDVAEAVRVLYGGSVKASNVAAIMAQPDVDGALVGGASLKADEFAGICRYRDHSGA